MQLNQMNLMCCVPPGLYILTWSVLGAPLPPVADRTLACVDQKH